jgi:hypothetical protein
MEKEKVMSVDLYGESYISNWDYARKIVTLGMNLPFYKVHSSVTPNNGCSMALYLEGFNLFQPNHREVDVPGLYAIYEKTWNSLTCLYTGTTGYSMHQRTYRFVKELHGVSRHDEDHPGARKARRAGVTPDNIFVKFFPRSEFPKAENLRVDYETLDETCAILLKSRFNTKRKI